jgi:hypothetical protein
MKDKKDFLKTIQAEKHSVCIVLSDFENNYYFNMLKAEQQQTIKVYLANEIIKYDLQIQGLKILQN